MAKRARGSTTRPGQRRPPPADDRAEADRSTAPPARADRPDRRRGGPRRRARGRRSSPRSGPPRRRPSRTATAPSATAEPVARGGTIAVRASQEYAYVLRDVRRIVTIGGGLIVLLIGFWAIVETDRGSGPSERGLTAAASTIAAMPASRRPTGARPEALFKPPPERQPLAARMRPRDLDEFVGQDHLVGERGPLRRGIARGHLASILLWGPPGTGKTSLARLLAAAIGAEFATLSAVMAGVADVRATIAEAQERACPARHPDGPLPRRDPSLQQGPAGRAAAARRGRHGHAHRGDDREPLLRGQRGAPVTHARVAARGAQRR